MEKMRRVRVLGIQFRDAIASALTSLKAGYSIENAFREAGRDMELLYGKKSPICQELRRIYKGLGNNIPLEKLIGRLGKESGNADIEEFAEVFAVAKRSGGNMKDIMGVCCNTITESVELQREFRILLSSRRFEMQIMSVVPFGIILYIGSASE